MIFFLFNKQNELKKIPTKYKQNVQKCQIWEYAGSLVQKRNILGLSLKLAIFKKNAEFINANGRNFQVLRNLILRKSAKFALINSAIIYTALIYSRINLFP